MSPIFILALILAIAFALILTNRLRADVGALGIALALGLTGLVTPQEVFSGFSRSAVMTLIGLFILTHALDRTGMTQLIGAGLARLSGGGEVRMLLFVMLGGAGLSLFMNNIAAAATLLPAAVDAVNRAKIAPSKVMMPLAFATSLGGMATLLTTANIIVSNALRDAGLRGYGLLDFAPVGIPICLVGMAFLLLIGRRLLPNTSLAQQLGAGRNAQDLATSYELQERLNQVRVLASSEFMGRTLAQSGIGARYGLSVLALVRGNESVLAPMPSEVIRANDTLIIVGREERVRELSAHGVIIEPHAPHAMNDDWTSDEVLLVEVIPAPRSRVVGQTLKQLQFREKFGASVVALWHGGRSVRTDLADLPLQFGDALLVHASRQAVGLLQNDPDFLVLRTEGTQADSMIRKDKAKLALLILVTTLVLGALEVIPIAQVMMLGALAMVLTKCLTMDEAYRAIEWRAIFVVAGMLPVSLAMTQTGAANAIGQGLVSGLAGFGPMALAAGLLAVTLLLTQVMSGQVTGVVLAPIAISAAQLIGADPRALAMIVALGCSLTFLTVTAHPVNVFVMGAGGYTPSDYPRLGLGLTVVVFIAILLIAPRVFPLS